MLWLIQGIHAKDRSIKTFLIDSLTELKYFYYAYIQSKGAEEWHWWQINSGLTQGQHEEGYYR
jgi:hypothetical protein